MRGTLIETNQASASKYLRAAILSLTGLQPQAAGLGRAADAVVRRASGQAVKQMITVRA